MKDTPNKVVQVMLTGGHSLGVAVPNNAELDKLCSQLDDILRHTLANGMAQIVSIANAKFASICLVGYAIHEGGSNLMEENLRQQVRLNKKLEKRLNEGEEWRQSLYDEEDDS